MSRSPLHKVPGKSEVRSLQTLLQRLLLYDEAYANIDMYSIDVKHRAGTRSRSFPHRGLYQRDSPHCSIRSANVSQQLPIEPEAGTSKQEFRARAWVHKSKSGRRHIDSAPPHSFLFHLQGFSRDQGESSSSRQLNKPRECRDRRYMPHRLCRGNHSPEQGSHRLPSP